MFTKSHLMLFFLVTIFSWMLIVPCVGHIGIKDENITDFITNEIAKMHLNGKEQPLHSVNLPDFAHIANVKEKKRVFFSFLAPVVEQENNRLIRIRQHLLSIQTNDNVLAVKADQSFITKLAKFYKVDDKLSLTQKLNELLTRVDGVPESLVLVQAANESAWGTSRFARIGLNFFGIWCYQPKCGMVPNARTSGEKHEVAAFKTVKQAVQRYFYNINSNDAYIVFRHIRRQLRDEKQPLQAAALASGLMAYSSRGEHYVLEITKMIQQNQRYFTAKKI